MTTDAELQKLAEKGKQAFEAGQYASAAETFGAAARGYETRKDALNAAEMKNNMSVALLQDGQAQQALEVALGTDQVFGDARDLERQGMALGNQAAALEALKRLDEALAAYERSALLFAEAGEHDLRAMVLKSAAAIKLRRGKMTDSAMDMLDSLGSVQKPSLLQRFLKFLLRLKP